MYIYLYVLSNLISNMTYLHDNVYHYNNILKHLTSNVTHVIKKSTRV